MTEPSVVLRHDMHKSSGCRARQNNVTHQNNEWNLDPEMSVLLSEYCNLSHYRCVRVCVMCCNSNNSLVFQQGRRQAESR
jgi:hypothetical protein